MRARQAVRMQYLSSGVAIVSDLSDISPEVVIGFAVDFDDLKRGADSASSETGYDPVLAITKWNDLFFAPETRWGRHRLRNLLTQDFTQGFAQLTQCASLLWRVAHSAAEDIARCH